MIKSDNVVIGGKSFIRTYSDDGRYIVRDGAEYTEAYDEAIYERVYTEGDKIPVYSEDATMEDLENALTELGVSV